MKSIAVKENILAFIVALVLSFALFFAINSFGFLRADIVGNNSEEEKNLYTDVIYEFSWDEVALIWNKNIEWLQSISLVVNYNQKDFSLNDENFSSKYEVSYNESWEENRAYIIITSIDSIEKWEKLLSIKYQNQEKALNISDVMINFTNWETENLSVANK